MIFIAFSISLKLEEFKLKRNRDNTELLEIYFEFHHGQFDLCVHFRS